MGRQPSFQASLGSARAVASSAAARLALVVSLAVLLLLAGATVVLGDSPAPSGAAAGDPRAGQAPGFVGNPGLAIALVVLIVLGSVALTLAWVRATGGRSPRDDEGR